MPGDRYLVLSEILDLALVKGLVEGDAAIWLRNQLAVGRIRFQSAEGAFEIKGRGRVQFDPGWPIGWGAATFNWDSNTAIVQGHFRYFGRRLPGDGEVEIRQLMLLEADVERELQLLPKRCGSKPVSTVTSRNILNVLLDYKGFPQAEKLYREHVSQVLNKPIHDGSKWRTAWRGFKKEKPLLVLSQGQSPKA